MAVSSDITGCAPFVSDAVHHSGTKTSPVSDREPWGRLSRHASRPLPFQTCPDVSSTNYLNWSQPQSLGTERGLGFRQELSLKPTKRGTEGEEVRPIC